MQIIARNYLLPLIAFAILAAFPGTALFASSTPASPDLNFVQNIARSNLEEIQLGRFAEAKSITGTVDEFAQRMVVDHNRAENRLDHLASDLHITPEMENVGIRVVDEHLSKLSGQSFESAYLRAVLEDHQIDIAAARYEEKSGEDPALRQYAASILPILETNLEVSETEFHTVSPRPWQSVENNEFVPFSAAGK